MPTMKLVLLLPIFAACADDPAPNPCEALAAGSCDAAPRCADLNAARLEVDAGCTRAPQAVGCISDQTVCAAAFTFASSPDAAVYRFTSTCIPRGFRPIDFDSRAVSWPSCSP